MKDPTSPPHARPHLIRYRLVVLGVVAAVGIAAALFLLRGGSSWITGGRSSATHASSDGYADPAVCASCHSEIAETYSRTGMGRSFSLPSSGERPEDWSGAHAVGNAQSSLRYTPLKRGGELLQRRSDKGFDGRETEVREERIDYVIGSGNHARSYLHRTPDGRLLELPVSWYTERSGYWGMSPGYDQKDGEDFRRAITPECMFCHNGYPQLEGGAIAPTGAGGVFPAKLAEGIDCQRCHGPGAAHVAAADSGKATPEQIRAAIVNPAKLSRDRQLEICMQCHLETSSRHAPNELRAWDREVFSYRPGKPLGDYKLYFDRIADDTKRPDDDTFEIAHAAYRLRKSACFRNSQMTCLTCHNPHDIPRGEPAMRQYVQVCQGCHQKVTHTVALPASSNCVSCHMPKRRTEDAVHVVMTDHWIQRQRPVRDLLAPLPETLTLPEAGTHLALYYPAHPPAGPSGEIAVAAGLVTDTNGEQGMDRLRALLTRYSPSAPEPYVALGKAYAHAGRNEAALPWFEAALTHRPNFRPAVQEIVLALFATHADARATEILVAAIAAHPDDSLLLTNLGNAYLRQGRPGEAKSALDRALAIREDLPEAQNLLGLLALQGNDAPAAERSLREAIRLQPDLAEARSNLANLLTGKHEYTEAAFHFEKALGANPEYAEAHHGLGLLLILQGNYAKAAPELETAVRLAPAKAQNHADLADLLRAQNRLPEAAREYSEVLRLAPGQPDAELGLGLTLLARGDRAGARPHLSAAAQAADPSIAGVAQQALSSLGG